MTITAAAEGPEGDSGTQRIVLFDLARPAGDSGTALTLGWQVVLGTAHPAKFPAAVKDAAGVEPRLPSWLSDLMAREEKYTVLPSSIKMVEDYISRHSRAASQGAERKWSLR